jgi:3-methyl-2-oxobutanoate hydroxymethyltransferase
MAREGIPVTDHIGHVPRWSTWTGVRAAGKTIDEAVGPYRDANELESVGAWAVEMEPVEAADFITRNTTLVTEGMGCGGFATGSTLSCDILGTNTGRYPRHAKRYADLAAEEARLQPRGPTRFAPSPDVRSAGYPDWWHEIHVAKDVVNALEASIGRSKT